VFAESDGNPFFVEELVASTLREGEGMPHRLHDLLTPRLLRLTALGRNVVRVAAVAGRQVDHDVLQTVAGLSEQRLDAGLRGALDEQVLVLTPDGRGYEFRHALMREAVYSQLLPGERSRAHGRYAQQLVADDPLGGTGNIARAAEIAQHFSAAGDTEASLTWARRAGRAAEEVYAFTKALRQYRRALELWSRVPEAATISGTSRRELLGDAIRVADRPATTWSACI